MKFSLVFLAGAALAISQAFAADEPPAPAKAVTVSASPASPDTATNVIANTITNGTAGTNAVSSPAPDPNDPVEKEFQQLLKEDDAAGEEVDQWIKQNQTFAEKGGGAPRDAFNSRIRERFAPVLKHYQDFLKQHPEHVRAHLAYGSFLGDIKDEESAKVEWEKARQLDPSNAAAWNNLADYYVHNGPIRTAIEYYEKAISLNPTEATYYHSLGDLVYLFRTDSKEYYHLTEQQVFDKALDLYHQSMQLAPEDFELAQDVAETYYGIKPFRPEAALGAWTNALLLATEEVQREGVYVHLARIHLSQGHFDVSRRLLVPVTNNILTELKNRIIRNVDRQEAEAKAAAATNAPPKTDLK